MTDETNPNAEEVPTSAAENPTSETAGDTQTQPETGTPQVAAPETVACDSHDIEHPDHPVSIGEAFIADIELGASETIKEAGDIIAKLIAAVKELASRL